MNTTTSCNNMSKNIEWLVKTMYLIVLLYDQFFCQKIYRTLLSSKIFINYQSSILTFLVARQCQYLDSPSMTYRASAFGFCSLLPLRHYSIPIDR